MKYFKKLIGKKVYLSPVNLEDVEIFTKWMNDFEVTDYVGTSHASMSARKEKEYIEENMQGKEDTVAFSIIKLEKDELIGNISLEKINGVNRTATLGILIGEAENRSKGYGTEAIQLVLDYGFRYLNLNNVFLELLDGNERALKCYEKCGFHEIGKRRKSKFINGNYYDTIYMDILAEEFKENFIQNKNV